MIEFGFPADSHAPEAAPPIAEPLPMNKRAATMLGSPPANAVATQPAPSATQPMIHGFLRPTRSATRPAGRFKMARANDGTATTMPTSAGVRPTDVAYIGRQGTIIPMPSCSNAPLPSNIASWLLDS